MKGILREKRIITGAVFAFIKEWLLKAKGERIKQVIRQKMFEIKRLLIPLLMCVLRPFDVYCNRDYMLFTYARHRDVFCFVLHF